MLYPYTVQEGGPPSRRPLPGGIQPSARCLAQGPDLGRGRGRHSVWDWPCLWECLSGSLSLSVYLCFISQASSSVFLCSSRSLFPPLFYSVCFCSCLYPSQFLFPFSSPFPVSRLCLCPGAPDLSGFLRPGTLGTGSGSAAGPLLQGADSTDSRGARWGVPSPDRTLSHCVRLSSDEPLSLGLFKSWRLSCPLLHSQH